MFSQNRIEREGENISKAVHLLGWTCNHRLCPTSPRLFSFFLRTYHTSAEAPPAPLSPNFNTAPFFLPVFPTFSGPSSSQATINPLSFRLGNKWNSSWESGSRWTKAALWRRFHSPSPPPLPPPALQHVSQPVPVAVSHHASPLFHTRDQCSVTWRYRTEHRLNTDAADMTNFDLHNIFRQIVKRFVSYLRLWWSIVKINL